MSTLLALGFLLLLALGVPIAFTIAVTAYAGIAGLGFDLRVVPQRIFGGIDNFVLLAVPLFIMAADLMGRSRITDDLIELTNRTVGRINGGLGHSNIVCSTLFGSISGAAVADAASLGKIFVPAMEREGYDRAYAAAVTAASSLQSPIIPPSILAVVYGAIMGVSVGALFAAGLLPGLLLCLACMAINAWTCRGRSLRSDRARFATQPWSGTLARAGLALLMPVIILGGIIGGIVTPTEAAAVAVAYALAIGALVRRTLGLGDLIEACRATARTSAQVLLIIGAAALMSWLFAMLRLPTMVTDLLLGLQAQPWQLLVLINLTLLFVGMFMEPAAAIILFGPMLLPVVRTLGLDPVHFGIVMLVNLTIGMVTPPVGTVLYATAAATNVSIAALSYRLLPFIAVGVVVVLLVTFLPDAALFMPRLFGYRV